eukprot:TRINITY_DN7196_c0_g1_i1.p1 TRINITY_DN7196_c0_g1~~TRINITY_DN7196_c0_g1_i1.p1  ORF type:complete len:145 (+),score=4.50 TRINITY_DN7196_c0_g1_i1:242-676(+)
MSTCKRKPKKGMRKPESNKRFNQNCKTVPPQNPTSVPKRMFALHRRLGFAVAGKETQSEKIRVKIYVVTGFPKIPKKQETNYENFFKLCNFVHYLPSSAGRAGKRKKRKRFPSKKSRFFYDSFLFALPPVGCFRTCQHASAWPA